MMPIGPLMTEHKLIERMVRLLNLELSRIQTSKQIDIRFVEDAADFFRIYTDICHHGKEERILFSELEVKPLSPEHRATMEELIREHSYVRRIVKGLLASKERYESGIEEASKDIERALGRLRTFYPRHIEREEKHFFVPAMEYFSEKERDEMLKAFQEFDRKLIHELYREKVMLLEQNWPRGSTSDIVG